MRHLNEDELSLTICLLAETSALSPTHQYPIENMDRVKDSW